MICRMVVFVGRAGGKGLGMDTVRCITVALALGSRDGEV